MRGEPKLPLKRAGKTPKWCERCGTRHAGGTTMCNLLPVYAPYDQPPRLARKEIAELVEDRNDEREPERRVHQEVRRVRRRLRVVRSTL